jgi:hypothetical protein
MTIYVDSLGRELHSGKDYLCSVAAGIQRVDKMLATGNMKAAARIATELLTMLDQTDAQASGDPECYWRLASRLQHTVDRVATHPVMQIALPLDGQLSMF